MAASKGRHRKRIVPDEDKQAKAEALETAEVAKGMLKDARARSSEVASIAATLRRIRERNHFGEMVRGAFDGT